MKKSLLTLVLAGLAATATAGTIYSYESGSTKSDLNFYGDLKVVGEKGHLNTTTYGEEATTVAKERGKNAYVRSRFGLKGSYTDGTLTYAFDTRFSNSYLYATVQDRPHTGPVTPVKNAAHTRAGYVLDYGYLTVAHKQLGSLSYGKTGTVLDLVEGSNTQNKSGVVYSAVAEQSSFKNTFFYRSPAVQGVNLVASYGSETSDEKAKQYGVGVEANKFDTNVGVYFAKTTRKVGEKVVGKSNSVAAQVVNSSVKGLTVALTGTYERTKVPTTNTKSRIESYGVGAKVSYTVNQYVKPYAGVSFVKYYYTQSDLDKGVVTATDKATQKVVSTYVGLSSNLYNYKSFSLSTFGEFSYARNVNKTEGKAVERANVKLGSVGLNASF